MKRCKVCDEEFEDKVSFCPVDATSLNELAAALVGEDVARHEFRLVGRSPGDFAAVGRAEPFRTSDGGAVNQ